MGARVAWFLGGFLVLCGGSILLPRIDLGASGLFYRSGEGFFLGNSPILRAIHGAVPFVVTGFVVVVLALLAVALLRRRATLGIDAKAALYLLFALALGPGLIVNTIFKDHWGRARPAQIVEFGGDKHFSPPFVPSNQCARNCSFPAGDPAIGFYLVSVAFLLPAPRRRSGIAAALALGAGLGFTRLAQGGHFLSDIIASGFLVFASSWLLHRALIVHDGFGALFKAAGAPPRALKNFAWLSLVTLVLFFVTYRWLDEPLARYCRALDPTIHRVFSVVTQLGEGGIYLVPLGFVLIWSLLTRRLMLAWRLGYVFTAVALPGLVADILKPVFGRARPELLFRDQIFGFTWTGPSADHWSFPSGHAVTIAALATALFALYPALWPTYLIVALLVAASRVIIGAHYLSDVIAGAYLGFVFAWTLAVAAGRNSIDLTLPPGRITDAP